jgi:hypothetical protein
MICIEGNDVVEKKTSYYTVNLQAEAFSTVFDTAVASVAMLATKLMQQRPKVS